MKRALVLSGGGSRGAYECGAWQALKEMNIRLDAVYGTSIGAINAALVAQGDLDRCVRLWNTITLNQIIAHIADGSKQLFLSVLPCHTATPSFCKNFRSCSRVRNRMDLTVFSFIE